MKKVSLLLVVCHHHLALLLLIAVAVEKSSIVTGFATTTGFASTNRFHHHERRFRTFLDRTKIHPINIIQQQSKCKDTSNVVLMSKKKNLQNQEDESFDNKEDESVTVLSTSKTNYDNNITTSSTSMFLDSIQNYDIETFLNNLLSTKNNGEDRVGTRGEIYFMSQAILVPCILWGGIPIVGGEDFLRTTIGIGIFVIGFVITTISFIDLGGDSLSPFPKPTKTNTLKTQHGSSKVSYGTIRHPMYTGLMSIMLGLSIWSNSIDRLIFTVILAYFINKKADIEEEYLIEQFPNEYPKYMEEVPNKFFPSSFWDFWS